MSTTDARTQRAGAPEGSRCGRVRVIRHGRYWTRVASWGLPRAPAAIVLPGMGADAYALAPQIRSLRRLGYATHVLTLPGFSVPPSLRAEDAHLRQLAAYIVAVARALGIERALFLGHSLGGGVALQVALAEPALVDRLVLIAPAAVGRSLSWAYRLLALPLVGRALLRPYARASRGVLRRFLIGLRRRDDPRFVETVLRHDRRSSTVARSMRAVILANQPSGWSKARCLLLPGDEQCGFTLTERLGELRDLPTLALWGADDRVISPRDARFLRAACPATEIHFAPGAGHLLPLEAPEWVDAHIARFAARRVPLAIAA